nr:hypothetical protein [Microbacterium mangrovi]
MERPATLRGIPVAEADGVSLVPVLRDPDAPTPHDGQYLELVGQRALYSGRFKAVSPVLAQDAWELYDIEADPAEVHDVAASHPGLVAEFAARWHREAWRNTVFPQDDDFSLFTHRPASDLEFSRPVTIMPGTPTLERWRSQRLTGMRSFGIEIALSGGVGEGVLVSHGDQGGGYLLAGVSGRLLLSFNAYGVMHRREIDVPAGVTRIDVAFDALPGIAWAVRVCVDGVDAGGFERVPMLVGMAPFTGISVGFEGGGPVDWELHAVHGRFAHRGGLRSVRYVPGPVAPENPEVMVAIGDLSDRLLD